MVKKNSCIFISGSGTNLNALIKSSRRYNFPINIKLVISNKKNAKGLKLAKKYFPKDYMPYKIGYISKGKKRFNLSKNIKW